MHHYQMLKLFKFSLPIILSRFLQTLGLVIGNIFVAQLSINALAASALATSISMALFTFASGCLLSLGPLFSRVDNEQEKAEDVLLQGFLLATILGLLLIFLFLQVETLLSLTGQSKELTAMVKPYFDMLCFAALPMLWTTLIQQYSLAMRLEKLLLMHSVFRLVIGIICNYSFIFGLSFGVLAIPSLGFTGLGIGVSVASWIGFIVLVCWLALKKDLGFGRVICRLVSVKYNKVQFSSQQLMSFFKLCKTSIPAGLQFTLEMMVLMIITFFIGRFGHAALGAWQVVSQYVLLFTMLPFGISQAVAIMTGKLLHGEKDSKENLAQTNALGYLRSNGVILVLIPALLCGGIYIFFPDILLNIYLLQHQGAKEALPLLPMFFILMALYQCFDGVRLVGIGILRGYLASFNIFIISLFAFAGMSLLVSRLLTSSLEWGAVGVIVGLVSGMGLATILTWYQQGKMIQA